MRHRLGISMSYLNLCNTVVDGEDDELLMIVATKVSCN